MDIDTDYQLIVIITNGGYADEVMKIAKTAGARGGTILHARGTGNGEIASFFGITIQSDKEMLLIVADKKDKKNIMQAVMMQAGTNSEAKSIEFSLPISDTLGLFVEGENKDPKQ